MKTYTEEEVCLLMKEQAKIVRHAAYDECNRIASAYFQNNYQITAAHMLSGQMMNLQHAWAIDMEEE